MLSEIELQKLQKLAKLSFSPEEITVFTDKLEGVLNMIDQLHEVQCNDIEPLRSVCETHQRMIEDQARNCDISDELFKNISGSTAEFAQEVKCFVVPKMVE